MRLSGMTIQNATRGEWLGEAPATIGEVVTDTRHFKAGQTFLALRGPNFDGHLFARDIADKAEALIGDRQGVHLWDNLDTHQLQVGDTLQALGDIAHAWREQLGNTTIIGISGSYAKTSLRSLLEHGLRGLGLKVSATRANLNNLVGVPQTLMSIPEDAEFGLIECGISEPGEMQRLARMLQPDIAVLTGLSAAHGEGLGGLPGIAREKALLLKEVRDWCALGEGVAEALQAFSIDYPHDTLVADHAAEVKWQLDGTRLTLTHNGGDVHIQLTLPARHWAANMALAASIILRATKERQTRISLEDIARVLADWQPEEGRMKQHSGRNGSMILDDCYNANPASMQAALDTLTAMHGKHVAILGDMAELGEDSDRAHAGLNLDGIDHIFLIGQHMKHLAGNYPEAHCFANTDAAVDFFNTYQPAASEVILIKASRSMALERIAAVLTSDAKEASHAV